MRLDGAVAVVTGGGSGIGAALAKRFVAEGAEAVVVADRDGVKARAVAAQLGAAAHAAEVDVADEARIAALVAATLDKHGRIDLFCSNAGLITGTGVDSTNEPWQTAWDVHVMSHVYASRAVLPSMLERGSGYLLTPRRRQAC